ncbi:MAG: CbtA family protein [Actinomycetota bacterium]|nr:CbtA family protein [Actinomycetota bacterium]
MVATYLRRGLAAGLLAGLLAGLFAFFSGEPLLDRAIGLEERAQEEHAHRSGHHEDPDSTHTHGSEEVIVSRSTQKVGLFFATGLLGSFVGGLFGLAFAYFRERLASKSDWSRSLSLAGAIFTGAVLIPFIKYPANPPTVGDPATIGERTTSYFAMVTLSLLVVLAAWHAARLLRERGVSPPVRQVAVGLGFALVVGFLLVALPAAADPGEFPAGLLWDFRLSSLGTLLMFWAGLGIFFGALCERANRRKPR